MAKQWWGTRKNVSPRLRLEVELMQTAFGETFGLEWDPPANLYWIGTIDINLRGLKHRDHTLKIIYPQTYPNRPPEAYILEPSIYSPKHQFEDGQLCLFNPKDGVAYGWNPASSTAVTVVSWAVEWIYSFYTWRATGRWPGTEEQLTTDRTGWLRRSR
ncbi:MAG: hypothetical protein GYB66_05860 [Chloroflexi bacterium]|nr:hypothetical protein [Chloroflexota bacterium]